MDSLFGFFCCATSNRKIDNNTEKNTPQIGENDDLERLSQMVEGNGIELLKRKSIETPGNEEFSHIYYENSIQIIDCRLQNKKHLIKKKELGIQVHLSKVFYEEPFINQKFLQEQLNLKEDQSWRKQMEWKKYLQKKKNGNDNEQLFLIDGFWVRQWIEFLLFENTPIPKDIDNRQLYLKIEGKEPLTLGEDLFVISQGLWHCLFTWYGGGPILKWKINHNLPLMPAEASTRPTQMSPEIGADYKIKNKNEYKSEWQNEQRKMDGTLINLQFNDKQLILKKGPSKKIYKPQITRQEIGDQKLNDSQRESFNSKFKSESADWTNQIVIFGLQNNSLFCYLNSVLQCLFSLKEFKQYFENEEYLSYIPEYPVQQNYYFSSYLKDFSNEILKTSKKKGGIRILKTQKLVDLIKAQKRFNSVGVQDAHEFLLYILNNLKDELTDKNARIPQITLDLDKFWEEYEDQFPSLIDKLFTVIEKTEIICSKCSTISDSMQYYLSFPLQVEGLEDVSQSLKLYQQPEEMPDFKCDKCKRKKYCQLQRKIFKLPEIFIVQLQRFALRPKIRKIRGQIKYDEYLDMEDFVDKEVSQFKCNQPMMYQLVAVNVHQGSINGGHYISYCLKEDGCWYSFDDDRVGIVSFEEVLDQDAYMLFYKRLRS